MDYKRFDWTVLCVYMKHTLDITMTDMLTASININECIIMTR